MARVETLRWLDDDAEPPPVSVQIIGGRNVEKPADPALKVMVPMADLIDIDAERVRLGKAIDTAERDLKRAGAKLANENFVAKAPPPVVAQSATSTTVCLANSPR